MFDVDKFTQGTTAPIKRVVESSAAIIGDIAESFDAQPLVMGYDESFASLAVESIDEHKVLCLFDHFILLGVNETDQEKMSLVFNFGEPELFGGTDRRPRIYAYSGVLVDTEYSGKCISTWKVLYDKYFRGTRCAKLGAYVELRYRDQWRIGYLTGMRLSMSSDKPQSSNFSFTMFVIAEGSF